MSRRHKETDIKITQPEPVEPVADCHQQITDDSTIRVTEGLRDVLKQPQFSISSEKLLDALSMVYDYTLDSAIIRSLARISYDFNLVDEYDNETSCQTQLELEQSLLSLLKKSLAVQKKAVQKRVFQKLLEDDNPPSDEEDEPRGRGRPMIKRLCSLFQDKKIWPLAKDIFRKIYHESIQKAVDLTQYLVCFVCSLFRISKTEVIDGRVAHFHRLMKEHFQKKMMPSLRKLQQGVQWLRDKTQTFFRNKKVEQEERLHQAWEALVQLISNHMVELIPQYAI